MERFAHSSGGRGRGAMAPRAGSRRAAGLTLLECVLASAMLGMVAAATLGTVSAIWGWQARQEATLGAAELANRLMLTYLDDDSELPSRSLPVAYGPFRYHWDLKRTPAKMKDPVDLSPEVAERRAARVSAGAARIEFVQVRVWLSEDHPGGSREGAPESPQAVVERLVDPLAFRNPDSIKKMFGNMEKLGSKLSDIERQSTPQPQDGDKEGGR
jgi:type II secretory pathway pseudopilin PulG